ncbi:MAG: hypothetical protein J6Q69_04265 [Clostridia bacterium]|nr:hypothetical protein [Clostridia bacterium]
MANNKKKAPAAKPQGIKTRAVANVNGGAKAPLPEDKKASIAAIIIASLVILAVLAGVGVGVYFAFFYEAPGFDYMDIDEVSKYISVSDEEYKNIIINLPLLEYSDAALTAEINSLLVKNKTKTPLYGGIGTKNLPITLGDVVSVWYRSYIIDDSGKEVETDSNLANVSAATLEVGSGNLVLGFEEFFLGKVPEQSVRFKQITEGTVSEGDVVYISFERISPMDDRVATCERIDLSRDDVDALYGTGFKDFLLGKTIGDKITYEVFPIEGGTAAYVDMSIDFVTRCEEDPLLLTVVYPADYETESLRGVTTYFEIYIDSVVVYDAPEFNEQFVTETLGYTRDSLASYAGATLTEKLTSKLKADLEESIERTNKDLVEEQLKKRINSIGTLVEYPEGAVEAVYDSQYLSIERYYENYAATYGFSSIDQAAIKYLGLSAGTDWIEYLNNSSKTEVKNKLVFYYIILKEGYVPTEEEIALEGERQIDREVDYQLQQYADKFASLTPAEYETQRQMLRDQIKSWYGDSMLREVAIYNYGIDRILENHVTVVKK